MKREDNNSNRICDSIVLHSLNNFFNHNTNKNLKNMQVKAKFLCNGVEKTKNWNADPKFLYNIKLTAVYDQNKDSENGKFFAATPNGQITLGTVNESAAQDFEPGKEYFVTFGQV